MASNKLPHISRLIEVVRSQSVRRLKRILNVQIRANFRAQT